VGVFASNVHRLRMLGDIARRHGRKLVALGRSVDTHARVARARRCGDGRPRRRAVPRVAERPGVAGGPRARAAAQAKILGVATGTQGERRRRSRAWPAASIPRSTWPRGDVVVLSSRVIPGNEPA
jgi:ribonuclease J